MLTNKEIQIYGPLQKLKILYEGFPHPPIVTLDEGLALAETRDGDALGDLAVGLGQVGLEVTEGDLHGQLHPGRVELLDGAGQRGAPVVVGCIGAVMNRSG